MTLLVNDKSEAITINDKLCGGYHNGINIIKTELWYCWKYGSNNTFYTNILPPNVDVIYNTKFDPLPTYKIISQSDTLIIVTYSVSGHTISLRLNRDESGDI